ncbi:hypothetical protein NW762_009303 [Fusarium torreyae]|uniref:Uncharacterized protein n=1 Tax=Fusarium torreyae TaxID=1237075 RepID=A0A9W8RVR3_9HYPO|nr:hypothetical protein NW762_009303 [Fusarium torreyae]
MSKIDLCLAERPGRQRGIILAMGLLVLFGLAVHIYALMFSPSYASATNLDEIGGKQDVGLSDIKNKSNIRWRYSRLQSYPDRLYHKIIVFMIQEPLEPHNIVVLFEANNFLAHPELAFDWLMNYWNITNKILFALTNDPG